MRFVLIFLVISLQKRIHCHDSESTEINHIEITPYYDTVIFSDVIDIMNELNRNSQFNAFTNSDSESDENVEDLLSEYQHYLDRAHEQKRIYLEKSNKTKNKVPVLRHDPFVKANLPTTFQKYNNGYYGANSYYNPSIFKFPPPAYGNQLDLFIPVNSPIPYNFNKQEHDTIVPRKLFNGEELLPTLDTTLDEKKPHNFSPLIQKSSINAPIKSPCTCSSSTFPCKCNCKQCVVPFNSIKNGLQFKNTEINRKSFPQNSLFVDPGTHEHLLDDLSNTANTINVKINVDIQLPKLLNGKQFNRDSALEYEDNSKELTSNIKLPATSFKFPIPHDMFGYRRPQKINRHDSSPFRKITIHKKKKSRNTNNNKKHRKKLITFHNVKLSPTQTLKPLVNETYNSSTRNRTIESLNDTVLMNATENISLKTDMDESTTSNPDVKNSTQFEEGIYFMVNISNNNENDAEEALKTGNSIELDFKTKPNISTTLNIREKRDLHVEPLIKKTSSNNFTKHANASLTLNQTISKEQNIDNKIKKTFEKGWFSDPELLYWPSNAQTNVTVAKPKNITDIILERENKKAKLNMTKESIRHNRTKALEQAIFGQVDWNDMDTVAPTFISFVGKYINGIITFCSPSICHSMKCADKTCIHRTCGPDDRFNHIGHCSGSNETDSVASMESIMDLPSNIAFEIVDILEDRMLGKLHGKVTLCISLKCITFAVSKKRFIKFKCISTNLNEMGHCLSIKKS